MPDHNAVSYGYGGASSWPTSPSGSRHTTTRTVIRHRTGYDAPVDAGLAVGGVEEHLRHRLLTEFAAVPGVATSASSSARWVASARSGWPGTGSRWGGGSAAPVA